MDLGVPLSPEERKKRNVRFIGVAGLGVAALVLGLLQLQSTIRKPLELPNTNSSLAYEDIQGLQSLRDRDTDSDQLSDYDELYTYKTSPYLADSDSDGIDDRTEIQGGTDPNCPQGQACGFVNGGGNGNSALPVNASTGNVNGVIGLGSPDISVVTLRETLKNAGVPQAQLDALDDVTLLRIYGDVLKETPAPTIANAPGGAGSGSAGNVPAGNGNASLLNIPVNGTVTTEQLQSLSAAEIRQLLLAAGVDATTLQAVDDATLRVIFLQAIEGGAP